MAYETIQYDVDDGVATITLNRPERMNAWNDTMASELSMVLDEVEGDDGVRVALLTGAGRAFCAGSVVSPMPWRVSPRSSTSAGPHGR